MVEERGQHPCLVGWRNGLPRRHLRLSESQQVRSKAAAEGRKPLDCVSPLKAAEWEAVDEEGGWAGAVIDERNSAAGQCS
jgi:hypothetical protein